MLAFLEVEAAEVVPAALFGGRPRFLGGASAASSSSLASAVRSRLVPAIISACGAAKTAGVADVLADALEGRPRFFGVAVPEGMFSIVLAGFGGEKMFVTKVTRSVMVAYTYQL